ncbi:hypothetical protein HK102_001478 [Quaeritorhiza haematococci]|nr:hypothetical protein HK102_001478 [Quaeritorhiza haematococci]
MAVLPNGNTVEQQLKPSQDQLTTIYIIAGYMVAILILWNLKYVNQLLWPFKIVTVALHEFGHASAGICTGAKIEAIELNPDEGGVTRMRGGNPYCTLPAGYIGSSFWGALMVLAGFNITASKVVAIIIGVCMLATLWWAKNWLTRVITVVFLGLIGLLWYLATTGFPGLRYFVLFMGVMSTMYSLWDIVEDLVTRKVNESDATKFSKLCCGGCLPPQFWGVIWFLVSCAFLAAAVIVGLLVFKDDGIGAPETASSATTGSS